MADPHPAVVLGGAGLLSAIGGLAGTVAAEWSVVLLAAIVGAGAAAAELETKTLGAVWWLVVKGVCLALLFTAALATAAAKAIDVPPVELLLPLAGLIAYRQEKVIDLVRLILPKKGPTP